MSRINYRCEAIKIDEYRTAEILAYEKLDEVDRQAIDDYVEYICGNVRGIGVLGARELICRLGMWLV
jgi:hypothetical protein